MQPIKINVKGLHARVVERPKHITSGLVGLTAEFVFDDLWNGLTILAVFKAGKTAIDVLVPEGEAVNVPPEVLATAYTNLRIGLYGVNGDGSIQIPTIWADAGIIEVGTDPSGDTAADPTLPIWAELQQRVDDLEDYLEENPAEVPVKSVNGVSPDENGDVEIDALPDNAEQLEVLIEADLLPAVYNANGAILTDENGNIILRY